MGQLVSAPAKIILLGEHSVVYGKPSLAVPLSSLRAFAEIIPLVSDSGLRITAVNLDNQEFDASSHSQSDQPLVIAAKLLLSHLNCAPPDANIILRSDIPFASGLGSGAAITTALFRALLESLDQLLPDEHLNDLVYEVEKIHHGTPSGVDNTVIVFEKPIYFVRDHPIEKLNILEPFTLLVADTGISASTKVAVSDVRTLYETSQLRISHILNAMGELVNAGRSAIETGDTDALGKIMNENHKLLRTLSVSSPELDQLVSAALGAGALGAKLSGGGRGGNMIALVTEETASKIKSSLLAAGAVKVYQTQVS